MRAPWMPVALSALACACCLPVDEDERDAGASDGGVEAVDAGAACDENVVPLRVQNAGDTDRYCVEVIHDGALALLQFDTGSGLTFLFAPDGPDYVENAATLGIGCEEVAVDARAIDLGDTVDGLPVIGLLGMDFLLDRPSVLDVAAATVTRTAEVPAALVEAPGVFAVPFDEVQSHALVPVVVDDVALRLMFDTGGGHTLWVGVEGQPGDAETLVQDAEGTIFTIFTGTGVLTLPGQAPRVVPVARTPEFPYFADTVAALGGNLHGLLGVTSFPQERLLFDGATSTLWVVPR